MDNKQCSFCCCNNLKLIYKYTSRPQGETKFSFTEENYLRYMLQCQNCLHIYLKHNYDLESIYTSNYVQDTYGKLEQLKATFEKIITLPTEKSDNIGRVSYIINVALPYLQDTFNDSNFTVLDVGSGLGVFPYQLAKEKHFICYALDPDPTAIEHIKNNACEHAFCSDFFKFKTEKKFHLITINKVLEHLKHPENMLIKAKDFLKNKGIIYFEVPDGELALQDQEGVMREEFFIEHYHAFSSASLALLCCKAKLNLLTYQRLQEPSTKYTLRAICSI